MTHQIMVLASSSLLIDMIRSYAAGFIFTTSLPPTVLAGALKAVQILASDEGRMLRDRHQHNVRYLRNNLLQNGFPVEHTPSHIIPVKVSEQYSLELKIIAYERTLSILDWKSTTVHYDIRYATSGERPLCTSNQLSDSKKRGREITICTNSSSQ